MADDDVGQQDHGSHENHQDGQNGSWADHQDGQNESRENDHDGQNGLVPRKTPSKDETEDTEDEDEFTPPDGGWGWVVCAVSFWTNATLFGVLNTFGLLFVSLVEEFGSEGDDSISFKTSWIGALQIATTFSCSPIASILTDRLGIRVTAFIGAVIASVGMMSSSYVHQLELMYLTYGVMVGFGASLLYTPSMVILGHYFQKRLGIVNGIVAFGSAVATIVLPFVIENSLQALGWRWTVRLQTLFYAVLIFGCFVWKPLIVKRVKSDTDSDGDGPKKGCACKKCCLCDMSIWKNRGYAVWAIALPLSFLGYFVPFVHLINHTKKTFPGSNPEILLMCIGVTTGISRLVSGRVADIPNVNRIRMQQVSFLILGLATACLPFATAFWMLVVLVLIMGVCDGCFICLLGPIAFDLLGTGGAAQGLGCLLGLMSGPMTAGPPIAGLLYDKTGSYMLAFVLAGIPPILGSILLFLVPYKIQVVPNVSAPEALAAHSMLSLDQLTSQEYLTPKGHRRVLVNTGVEDPSATPQLVHRRHQLKGRQRTSSVPLLISQESEVNDTVKKVDKQPGSVYLFSSVPVNMNQA